MTDQSLILVDSTARDVIFPDLAVSIRDEAIEQSSLIARVTNAEQNDAAIAAQKRLKEVCSVLEKCRKAAKQPSVDEGRRIDARVAEFIKPAEMELIRIAGVTANFAALEFARQRAAQNAENERLSTLEREREALLAASKSLEEHQAIREAYDEKAAEAQKPVPVPVKAAGQVVSTEWEILAIDDWKLLKLRPDLVRRIEWDRVAIKRLLSQGTVLPGVTAKEVVKSTVRVTTNVPIQV